jgi:hypothetical protein
VPSTAMACGGSVMVVTFLGWWTWTACFFCLLATEIPTGRRSRGRARPGRKIVQRASGSERVRDEESCEPSGQAQRSRGLARSGPPVKIEGPEDKSSSLVHQELLTSAGVAARGSCSIHVQDERRTSCFTATGYASGGSHHLASLRRAGSRSERRLPWRKLQTALGFLGVVRTFLCFYQDHNLGCPGLTRCGANPFTKSLPGVALNFVPASRKAGS